MVNLKKYSSISPKELLDDLGLFKVPVNLEELCSRLGVNVSYDLKLNVDHSGEIHLDNDNNIDIWINPLDSEGRRRFTLAHELGHLVHDIIPSMDHENPITEFIDKPLALKRDGRQHPSEYRANDFAAKLLMPTKLVIEKGKHILHELKNNNENKKVPLDDFVQAMASEFGVSVPAMKVRLEVVGIA